MVPSKWLLSVAWMLVLLAIIPQASSASSSSSSADYNPMYYDRQIHFTPDGRLLQVEYAAAAADNSSPLVVCQFDPDTIVIMACSSAGRQQQQNQKRRQKPQDRLVVVEDTVVVAMSGVLADSLALLKSALRDWEEYKIVFGDQDRESVMLSKFANAVGEACHHNCFQGGVRPYGSTMLVMGVDIPADDKENSQTDNEKEPAPQYPFRILQTDPSGGVTPIPVVCADQQQSSSRSTPSPTGNIHLLKIIGGNPDLQKKIQKGIQRIEDGDEDDNNMLHRYLPVKKQQQSQAKAPAIWERLRSLAFILMEAQQDQANNNNVGGGSASFFGLKKRKRVTDKQGGSSSNNDDGRPLQSPLFKVEIVVLSRKLGIYRLPEEQVEQLLHEVHEDSH